MVTVAQGLYSTIQLKDEVAMPLFGLGMFRAEAGEDGPAEKSALFALQNGYRMIDTAVYYKNEKEVGRALKKSGLKRKEVFIVSKLWTNGFDSCHHEFNASLQKLDCGYIDLYLIHSPANGQVLESYKALMQLQQRGLVRSIGVSNFGVHHLEAMKQAGVPTPAVNQFEFNPWMRRPDLVKYCHENGIAVMGYSPLVRGQKSQDPTLIKIANKLGKTVGQVLVRYSVQAGHITIPKATKPEHILENAQVFDWSIPEEDIALMNSFPESASGWNPVVTPWKG